MLTEETNLMEHILENKKLILQNLVSRVLVFCELAYVS